MLRTTEVYLHVTTDGAEHVREAVDALMAGLLDFGDVPAQARSGGTSPPMVPST